MLTPHVETIKPFDPTNPNDPNTPKPGQPIDPENPNGPKWTKELIDKLNTTKHVTRTITYVDDKGNKVEYTDKDGNKSTADVTDKVTFTREAKINVVTGAIEYGKWTPVNNDTTFDKVTSPVVPGYVLKDASQKEVAATENLIETSKDENIKVVYVKLGSWVPKVPEGATPVPPITYPNDPTDPTKPGTDKPRVPHVPGFIPVDPNGTPLKPVDPNDPTKGYEVPPVPTDPSKDTQIKYVPVTPEKPKPTPVTPTQTPVVPVQPEGSNKQSESNTPKYADDQNELPNTGTENHAGLATLGLLGVLSGFGLVAHKKREE